MRNLELLINSFEYFGSKLVKHFICDLWLFILSTVLSGLRTCQFLEAIGNKTAWSCRRTGTRIINGERRQGFKADYEGCWDDVAPSNLFRLAQSILDRQLIFPLSLASLCPVILSGIHSEMWAFMSVGAAKTRQPVLVYDSTAPHNQRPEATICFFWLWADCSLCHLPDVPVWAY